MFKPYIKKSKVWDCVYIGIDGIFNLSVYKKVIIFSLCYFGTIRKRYDISFYLFQFFYEKIKY